MMSINDTETVDLLRYGLSIFKFKDTIYGFNHLSGYIAALCFEKIISYYAKKNKISEYSTLREKISRLKSKGLFKNLDLVRYNSLRNKIVHQGTTKIQDDEIKNFYSILCNLYGSDYSSEINKCQFEDLYTFGFNKNEVSPSREYLKNQIKKEDFNNVYELSRKNNLLRKYIIYLLEKKELSSKYRIEEIPEFTRTSISTWLPIVYKNSSFRSHIYGSSMGAAFTIKDIRLGMDFGERAYDDKIYYYKLLKYSIINNNLIELHKKGYFFVNTYWYFNISEIKPICNENNRIIEVIENIDDLIDELIFQKNHDLPITSNKYLISKVIEISNPQICDFLESLPDSILLLIDEMQELYTKIKNPLIDII